MLHREGVLAPKCTRDVPSISAVLLIPFFTQSTAKDFDLHDNAYWFEFLLFCYDPSISTARSRGTALAKAKTGKYHGCSMTLSVSMVAVMNEDVLGA
jgi:hypothetical protein